MSYRNEYYEHDGPPLWGIFAVVGLVILVLGGLCYRSTLLPKDLRHQAEQLSSQIDAATQLVLRAENGLAALKKSADWTFFARYAERERWSARIANARTQLDTAKRDHTAQVLPLVKKNSKKDAAALTQRMAAVRKQLSAARTESKVPHDRMTFLGKMRREAPQLTVTARQQTAALVAGLQSLDTVLNAARVAHPQKDTDILKRRVPLAAHLNAAQSQLATVETEFATHTSGGDPDYARFGTATQAVKTTLDTFQKDDKALRAKIAELDTTYEKILTDMRIDYYVQIIRQAWDEDSDFNFTDDHTYAPKQVSKEVFDYFDRYQGDVVAECTRCRSTEGLQVDAAKWAALGIDQSSSQMPGGYDSASWWVVEEGTDAKYFHKYLYVENGKRREAWEEIDEEDFPEYTDDIGMALMYKPAGVYEEEMSNDMATPAGMAFVGNPKYGQWQTDASGQRHWSWLETYAFYHLMFGGHYRHSYNNWDDWNRNYRGRRAYYGGTNDDDRRYGSYSPGYRSSTSYAASTFRSTPVSNLEDASARGAGPARRAGGPGGGGK